MRTRFGRTAARGAGLAALFAMAGCAGGSTNLSGLYGSAVTEAEQGEIAAAPSQTTDRPIVVNFDPATECPQINVPAGTSSYATYAGEPGAANFRFQARIADFARECVLNSGNTVTIKIGVEGLVVLGEKGSPGTFPATLRIAVKNRGGKVVSEQLRKLSVTVPAGSTQASFRVIDDSAIVPLSADEPLRGYEIEVGFPAGKAQTRPG
jgi:hypothetical protein